MGSFGFKIALFISSVIPGVSNAKNTDPFHSLGAYQVGFKDLHGLTPVEGLWGVGFSVVSEIGKQGSRSSVAVFDTELTNVHFDLKALEKNQKTYYLGRKKWIEKINQSTGAETLLYAGDLPFRALSFGSSQGYRVGFRYRNKERLEAQYSYYLVCNKRVFHLKSIFPARDAKDIADPMEKVISGFQCRRDPEKVGQYNTNEIKEYWKKANSSPVAKRQAISALRDFVLEYEKAHSEGSPRGAGLDPIRSFLKKYSLFDSAYADDPGRCFNAGWPSQWTIKNGSKTCARHVGIDGCGSGQIKCNPMVFGEVCISDSLRAQATQACNAEYASDSAKHDAEIQALVKNDPQALLELEGVADTVCAGDPYRGSNYGLCTTLYERLSKIDPAVPQPMSKGEVTPEKINPKDYDDVHELTQTDLSFLEHCYADEKKNSIVPSVVVGGITIDCVATQKRILANLKALEKIENDPKLGAGAGGSCQGQGGPLEKNVSGALDAMKDKATTCTAKEKAAQGSCGKDILCSAGASVIPPFISAIAPNLNIGSCNISQDGCLTHAATGVVEALWGTIKGILGLAYDVVEGVVSDTYSLAANGAKSVANFFGATYELEDASSFKCVQLAQTGTGMLNDFISDPGGTMKKLFNGIWEGINQFMMNDVFCSKWSGAPHLSTCTEPSSGWECMSCKQKLNGVCTVIGYVAAEVVAAIFTGGISGAAEAAGIGAQVGRMLTQAQKVGKLKGAKLLDEFPLLAKTGTKAVQTGTKIAEGTKYVSKGLTKLGTGLRLNGKAISGGAQAMAASLRKLSLVKAPMKVVKLTGQKLQSFIASHNAYMKKMTAMGRDLGKTFVTGRSRELASKEKIIAKTGDLELPPKAENGLKRDEVQFSLGKVTTDEDGSWYMGYNKITAKDALGNNIGYVSYKIEDDVLTIGWSRVDEAHRGKGYQTRLFEQMFEQHPEIKTVRTSLDDVNQGTFSEKLSALVKAEKDYKAPSSPTVEQKHLDRLTKKGKVQERELNECCADYLGNLQKTDPKRFEELMDQALKGTPAWRTREKFGFSKFGDMKNYNFSKNPKDGSIDFRIEFDAVRP
ncbi:MAG: hypothetical protein KGP28_09480 [Bdellovibrionales bacterium]|nr:hypothetical protein [Bdellovibrionales bacterium]